MSGATFTDIRSLHGPGPISVIRDGKALQQNKFITCGTDGTVYVWGNKTFTSDKTAAEMKNVGEQTYSIAAWRGENVYFGFLQMDLISGLDQKRIGVAPFDNLEDITPLMTFNLEPTTIDVSDDFLVAGSSEFLIKATTVSGNEDLGNAEVSGEVLCVKIDPKQEFFATAITDGSIFIYGLKKDLPQVAKISNVFPAMNTISVDSPRILMAWSNDGEFLYVPHIGSIKIISRTDWKPLPDGLKAPGRDLDVFSVLTLSPCGKVLAAATMKRHVCLFNLNDRSFITQYEYNRNCPGKTYITDLEFAPFDARSIIVADSNEGMCMIKNAVPAKINSVQTELEGQIEIEPTKKSRKRILDSDEEDSNDDTSKQAGTAFLDDAADEDTNLSTDLGAIKKKYGFTNQPTLDDYLIPEEGDREKPDFRDLEAAHSAPVIQKVTQVVEYDPPSIPSHFASGASPKTVSSRYLKWNRIGMIRNVKDDDINNIEIEFHNANIHSEIVFENSSNYSMGDLSEEAIALANTVDDESEQSELWVYHVTAWDGTNRKWTANFPLKENPVDVLVSQKLIAVLTNQRNLRIFTLQGTQRHIIAHPCPTLTAACLDTKFALISITGSEYFEESKEKRIAQHNYVATIYDLDPQRWFHSQANVTTVSVPVKPGETIRWAGYTNEGKLCVMDSAHSVRILTKGGVWIPIFEGCSVVRSKSDALWPIAVLDGAVKQFRYLYCKGSKYPLIALKLAPNTVRWSLSFCQPDSEKSKLEEELFLNELDQNDAILSNGDIHSLINQHLQCVVKLFALACKSERETRAWEFSHLVPSSKGIQALVNYATKTRRNVLAEKISAFGRDNLTRSSEHPPSRSQDDFLGPKKTSIPRKSLANNSTTFNLSSQVDVFETQEVVACSQTSEVSSLRESQNFSLVDTSLLDTSICSPARSASKNPFKRAADSYQEGSSRSVFDQLEEENPRKRVKEDSTMRATASKQAKLDFNKGKENKVSPYSLWLEENEENLKDTFSGDIADFQKFCIGQFKILPPAQKKILKERAEGLS